MGAIGGPSSPASPASPATPGSLSATVAASGGSASLSKKDYLTDTVEGVALEAFSFLNGQERNAFRHTNRISASRITTLAQREVDKLARFIENLKSSLDPDLYSQEFDLLNQLLEVPDWRLVDLSLEERKDWLFNKISEIFAEKMLDPAFSVLLNNKTLVVIALKFGKIKIENISEALKNDPDVIKAAVFHAIKSAPSLRKDDANLILDINPQIDRELRAEPTDVIHAALSFVTDLPEPLAADLEYRLKNDTQIVRAAIERNPFALQFVSESLRNDLGLVILAISQNPWVVRILTEQMKDNPSVMMAAVQKDGLTLEQASKRLKDNRSLVEEAINQNPWALAYASKELRGDVDIVMAAALQKPSALNSASETCRNDLNIIKAVITRHGWEAVKFVPFDMVNLPEIQDILYGRS